jgi:hypothetical protein
MMLKERNGEEKIRHEEKDNIIWEAYKERFGTSKFSHMHFNLSDLMESVPDLQQLIEPFSTEEIDSIVTNLPTGKSPRPEGFNTDFMKKCWQIISP